MRAARAILARVPLLLALLLAAATAAQAGGADDGEAGLKALDQLAYPEAVRLFTKALADGDLATDDRELAYVSRAKAYLGEGDRAHAVADLKEALRLKPDDTEAQDALRQAQAANRENASSTGRDPWGLLRTMAGKYYWYQLPGRDPHAMFSASAWVTPDQTLATSVHSKAGLVGVGEYQYDPGVGELLTAGNVANIVTYGTAQASASSVVEYFYLKETPIRDTLTAQANGSIVEHEEAFKDGRWQDQDEVTFVETSVAELQAAGLMKQKR